MKTTLRTKLYLAFGFMAAMVLMTAVLAWFSSNSLGHRLDSAKNSTDGAVALANAQSALWELRYGFPQFMVGDPAAQKKIREQEIVLKARLDAALKTYSETGISDQEKSALKGLQDIYVKYMAARPKWFDLYGAGELEAAKEWRAATTTPFGAGTVKGFADLIELQKKVSLENYNAAVDSITFTNKMVLLCTIIASLASALIAAVIVRSLMRQLGGEPAQAVDLAKRIAEGDLTTYIHTVPGDQSSLIYAMKQMRDSLADIVAQVRARTETIAQGVDQIAASNQNLSSRTELQAGSLEETASSMQELTSTVKQNENSARQANALAASASDIAGKGGIVVSQVVETMGSINESATKIVDIISVIDGIAFQTNILALNAAVEAARAGEQGRGFAVVASEVRNLAQRSAAAAKEIKTLIGDSVDKVENGSKLVSDAGITMKEIVESVKRVTEIMAAITVASQDQSSGIQQVNQTVTQMDQVTQQNAQLVEEAAAASESMLEQTARLSQLVSMFKIADVAENPGRQQHNRSSVTPPQRAGNPIAIALTGPL